MFGAVAKSYYADILGVDPKKIFCVSVMPCLAKKHECDIPNLNDACGDQDVDLSLTNREVDRMIEIAHIIPAAIEETELDKPLGIGSGAGNIFGATGGVMEAALRTAYEVHTGKTLPKIDFEECRGIFGESIREATVDFAGLPVKIAICYGLSNARKLMEEVREGNPNGYHFIEVMACPGGCIGGAGQPYHHGKSDIIKRRMDAIYREDAGKPIRKSHENPDIIAIYKEYYGEPCGHLSHEQLHTHYFDKSDKIEATK